jgi:hypothetical protein
MKAKSSFGLLIGQKFNIFYGVYLGSGGRGLGPGLHKKYYFLKIRGSHHLGMARSN